MTSIPRRDVVKELEKAGVELHPPESPTRKLFLNGRYIFQT